MRERAPATGGKKVESSAVETAGSGAETWAGESIAEKQQESGDKEIVTCERAV